MQKIVFAILLLGVIYAQKNKNVIFIDNLLKKMTLEEKVGQMTQLTLDEVLNKNTFQLDSVKLRKIIVENKIGSILNTSNNTGAVSLKRWREIITEIQNMAAKTRLKIPILYGVDAIHGPTYLEGAFLFPHNIGFAAGRNLDLAKKAAQITALATSAMGIRWNFAPVLDVGRNPLWPRFEETFGEDVFVASRFGVEFTNGYEENYGHPFASTMKHYLGYSVPLTGKDRTAAYIPENYLREYILPPFAEAVKAGASSVMINSGSINGIPVHSSKFLINDLLKKELGFKGLVVTDWNDIEMLFTDHKTAPDYKTATMSAINAGIDMSMVPYGTRFIGDLLGLVREGKVSRTRIDDAVRKILELKQKLGLFDNPFPDEKLESMINPEEGKAVAYQSAAESITLLKNDNSILPLKKGVKLLLAGPASNNLPSLHGSWSFTWKGDDIKKYPAQINTIKQAIENIAGKENVICQARPDFEDASNFDISFIQTNSQNADVIVICLGENAYAESTGNIDDLEMPENQMELVKAAAKTGKPVVLCLLEGRPRIINKIEPLAKAILMCYRPGSMGADAIADIIMGKVNPSGKLPFTYPRATGNLVTYDTPVRGKNYYNPQWPFGFGLSYSTIEYSNLKVNSSIITGKADLKVTVEVRNKSEIAALHTVELYISDLFSSIEPPIKRLKNFTKINLAPDELKTVEFIITLEDLKFIDEHNKRIVEKGDFEILIGNLKQKIRY